MGAIDSTSTGVVADGVEEGVDGSGPADDPVEPSRLAVTVATTTARASGTVTSHVRALLGGPRIYWYVWFGASTSATEAAWTTGMPRSCVPVPSTQTPETDTQLSRAGRSAPSTWTRYAKASAAQQAMDIRVTNHSP